MYIENADEGKCTTIENADNGVVLTHARGAPAFALSTAQTGGSVSMYTRGS